ncbi:MAG: hypothetical protein HQM04_10110 [Magnetococcales bacterium]|nr:hypothetical protein [Magnetococcales bacterium]MBF0115384.1 hypothetical protein [Magnetococcales bacterium]
MRWLIMIGIMFGALSAAQAEPWLDREQQEQQSRYRACLLGKVQATPSAVAAGKLQWACQRRFQAGEVEEGREFEECLLRHLPQVQNDASAQAMIHMCEEQFAPRQPSSESTEGVKRVLRWLQGEKPPVEVNNGGHLDGNTFETLQPWQGGQGR